MKISPCLEANKERLKKIFSSDDVVFADYALKGRAVTAVFVDSLTDKKQLSLSVIEPLKKEKKCPSAQKASTLIPLAGTSLIPTTEDAESEVLAGKTIILFDKSPFALSVDVKKFDSRAIAEPPTSTVVKGPREGFTENIKTNLSLVRRRIKSKFLKVENFKAGRYTQTDISLVYLNSIAEDSLVKKVREKIKKIKIDGIPDSSYVAKIITDHKTSVFKQTGGTEKPDILCAKLLEGRVGIIVDGSPIVITAPYVLFEDFQSAEDYYQNNYRSNMARAIRFVSLAIAVLLPAAFVSAQLFHLQVIPLNFLLTIVSSIKGIPLSPSFEMFFTLLIFEILNEASVRMPKYVGMALSIVGALVLGDTAVRAGIVSTPTILIMALSGICLYTVPELVDSMSFLRLIYLLVAGSMGAYGLILVTAFITIYLTSMENFDVPFLAPFAPMVKDDFKDSFYMTFVPNMINRPLTFKPKDKVRMKCDE